MRGNYLKRRSSDLRIRVLKKRQTDLFAPNGTHEKAKNVSSKQICVSKKGKTFLFFNMVFATLEGMEFIFAWMNFYGRKNKIMLK